MDVAMNDHVLADTPRGKIAGRVVGLEQRDISRHGNGEPQSHVCIAPDTPGEAWVWVPAECVAKAMP